MPEVTEPAISTKRAAELGRIVYGVSKLADVLRNGAWAAARAHGLTPTQGQILVLLRSRGRKGLRLGAVAGELAVTPATASDAVATLERKRLLERHRDPDDGRAIAIRLTSAGRRLAYEAMQWSDFVADAFSVLSAAERGITLRALSKAMRALEQDDRMEPARMCLSCAYYQPDGGGASSARCAYGGFAVGDTDLRLDCAAHRAAT